jgi:hypothetical protein
MLVTALVAVLGIGGTAYAAKLITGANIKDGSITVADLSRKTQTSLHGAAGAKGLIGSKGSAGAKGARGSKGRLGVTGAQGVHGIQGAVGAAGPAGAQGAAGSPGATGLQGANGSNGAAGAAGTNGSNGAPGTPGTNGADGTDAVRYFGAFGATGTLDAARRSGIALPATLTATGIYNITLTGTPDVSACVAVAQLTDGTVGFAQASLPTSTGHVDVKIWDNTIGATNRAFSLTVSC